MAESVIDWMHSDRPPADYYELVGRPRFDPDRVQLLAAIRAGLRQVLPLQNHRDAAKARQAVDLQKELGRADAVFSDPIRHERYNEDLLAGIERSYQSLVQGQAGWPTDRLRDWLAHEHRVHHHALDRLCQALVGRSPDLAPPAGPAPPAAVGMPRAAAAPPGPAVRLPIGHEPDAPVQPAFAPTELVCPVCGNRLLLAAQASASLVKCPYCAALLSVAMPGVSPPFTPGRTVPAATYAAASTPLRGVSRSEARRRRNQWRADVWVAAVIALGTIAFVVGAALLYRL